MKHQRGFSLIELMLYMGLTSVLIALMSQVFLATLNVRIESANTSGVQRDGRFIIARLGHDIRKADAILSPDIGVASSSMTLIITEGGSPQAYRYAWDGQNVTVATVDESVQLNSNDSVVTYFSLTRRGNSATVEDGKDTLSVSLGLDGVSDVGAGRQTLEMDTTISQR